MTPARALIAWLTSAGVTLRLEGEAIVHRGPRSVLSLDVLAKLREHKAEAIAELKRLAVAGPPFPANTVEHAALVAASDHCDRATAHARALAEHGHLSWPALAAAHRERILARLQALPPASNDDGRRLLRLTRGFLDSEHWQAAVGLGWELIELFGINPYAPLTHLDGHGLVTGLALSRFKGGYLENITEDLAIIRCRSGSLLTYRRGSVGLDDVVLWWECPALIGSPEHAQ